MYQRILVATDGSNLSRKAVSSAIALAALCEAELVVVKVVARYPMTYFEGGMAIQASEVARILRGKHKPTFTTHVDTGDFVVVVNADKVKLTGNKLDQKFYNRHSGIPGGFKATSYRDLMEDKPTFPVEKAVRGMLPKNVLGREMFTKLKVYATPDHPHVAQKPTAFEIK